MTLRQLTLVKHGLASYHHIEDGIQRAAERIPDLDLRIHDLHSHYLKYRNGANGKSESACMALAVDSLLKDILNDSNQTLLLLNGFLLERHKRGFFATLKHFDRTIIAWQIDDPYYIDFAPLIIDGVDLLLTVDSSAIPIYKELGKQAHLFPLACDPFIHHPYDAGDYSYESDICFIGTPFAGSQRVQTIDHISTALSSYHTRILGASSIDLWKNNLTNASILNNNIQDIRVSPTVAARFFSRAKINLNLHKDSYGHVWDRNKHKIEAQSPCERTFAIAGCRGFQLVDNSRKDLSTFFSPNNELVVFNDSNDLKQKLVYYLKHDDRRNEIAQAGYRIAISQHTYLHRLRDILALL